MVAYSRHRETLEAVKLEFVPYVASLHMERLVVLFSPMDRNDVPLIEGPCGAGLNISNCFKLSC
jgi:hypothetical protein